MVSAPGRITADAATLVDNVPLAASPWKAWPRCDTADSTAPKLRKPGRPPNAQRTWDIQRPVRAYAYASTAPTPSFQPTGIITAATSSVPLSVASRLNCDAAFRVSSTSTLIPRALMAFLVSGLSGAMRGPTPNINKSMPVAVCQRPCAHSPRACNDRGQLTRPRP